MWAVLPLIWWSESFGQKGAQVPSNLFWFACIGVVAGYPESLISVILGALMKDKLFIGDVEGDVTDVFGDGVEMCISSN